MEFLPNDCLSDLKKVDDLRPFDIFELGKVIFQATTGLDPFNEDGNIDLTNSISPEFRNLVQLMLEGQCKIAEVAVHPWITKASKIEFIKGMTKLMQD